MNEARKKLMDEGLVEKQTLIKQAKRTWGISAESWDGMREEEREKILDKLCETPKSKMTA